MSKTTYLIFAILFSALSIIYPAIVLIQHPHGYVICTYIYTALTVTSGALCWVGHAFKSNPQRTEKAENKRLYDEFVRLDDFCATKGCICCVCENKKTCKECSKCESLKTEKCNNFKIDVSKYTRAIERADKLQKQVDELTERYLEESKERCEFEQKYKKIQHAHNIGLGAQRSHWEKKVTQAVEDTAKEILIPLMETEKQIDPLKTGIRWSVLKGFCKKYNIEVK